jgi:opacity protein-like surface antigen
MRNLSTITILLCLITSINAQKVHFDVKAGFSPGSNNPSNVKLMCRKDPMKEFRFCLLRYDPQFYGGFKINVQLDKPFFLETGLTYTKRTSVYQAHYTNARFPDSIPQIMKMSASQHLILLPVDVGVSLGAFDITSGLRLNKVISSTNDLSHIEGYENNQNSLSWGWQAGVRYAFRRMMIGVEYQGEMTRDCENMNVSGESLALRYVPGRFVFSAQYRF